VPCHTGEPYSVRPRVIVAKAARPLAEHRIGVVDLGHAEGSRRVLSSGSPEDEALDRRLLLPPPAIYLLFDASKAPRLHPGVKTDEFVLAGADRTPS